MSTEEPLRVGPGLCMVLLLGMGCPEAADLPAGPHDLEILRRHSTFRPAPDARVDLAQAPPSRLTRMATSSNVGNIKVIVGDSTNVSAVTTSAITGFGLRMDEGRQDIARITRQVIEEQGDIFDFIVVFPAFDDLLNPGFAYFTGVRNQDQGIGLEALDLTTTFGSAGRLQGFVNMNSPAAYTELDGLSIRDPSSSIFPIMGQEMTHRWLAFARIKKPGFNDGQSSTVLMGRDLAHWSALMHTGPLDENAVPSVSVQDGVAWHDNGNGTFTVEEVFSDTAFNISRRAHFTPLDLYLMGLIPREEVTPFYVIAGARMGTTTVPASARLERGMTVSGQRLDLTVDHLIAAMGERVPSVENAQKAFNMAVVVLTRPGQSVDDVMGVVGDVDAFRRTWEERFSTWTNGRGSLCTSLMGNCTMAQLKLSGVTLADSGDDGALHPGEWLSVQATVENNGEVASQPAQVVVDASAPSLVEMSPAPLGVVPRGGRTRVTLRVRPLDDFPCNTPITIRVRVIEGGNTTDTLELSRVVGVRVVHAWRMEQEEAFRVDPASTDSAAQGHWSRGIPRRTDLRAQGRPGVIVQPDADSNDDGNLAWVTDPGSPGLSPGDVDATDVDDGFTTLQTPDIELVGLVDPVLSFSTWHTALVVDQLHARVDEATGDDLVTTFSVDGREPAEVDRDATNTFTWRRKSVRLVDILGGGMHTGQKLVVRFSVGDQGPEQNVVEAGIDDVVLTDLVQECVVPPPVGSSSSRGAEPMGGASSAGTAPSRSDGERQRQPAPAGPCACALTGERLPWMLAFIPIVLRRSFRRGGRS